MHEACEIASLCGSFEQAQVEVVPVWALKQ
jgi:hypothetical protein